MFYRINYRELISCAISIFAWNRIIFVKKPINLTNFSTIRLICCFSVNLTNKILLLKMLHYFHGKIVAYRHTVWKSNIKRDHPQKFSVKLHTWILPNLLLEMIVFLSLWDTFRLCWLNEICRVGFLLTFTLMKFFCCD